MLDGRLDHYINMKVFTPNWNPIYIINGSNLSQQTELTSWQEVLIWLINCMLKLVYKMFDHIILYGYKMFSKISNSSFKKSLVYIPFSDSLLVLSTDSDTLSVLDVGLVGSCPFGSPPRISEIN